MLRKAAIVSDGTGEDDTLTAFLSDALRLLHSIRPDNDPSSHAQGQWQVTESVIHALSALAVRLPQRAAESVCTALLGAVSVDSSSRAVVTTTVHAFMAFSPSLVIEEGWLIHIVTFYSIIFC